MEYKFEWDREKGKTNWKKHGVSFELAAMVFKDPRAITIYDQEHSEKEERWLTMGQIGDGRLLIVVHTHIEIEKEIVRIRIISSRKATRKERRQYEEA